MRKLTECKAEHKVDADVEVGRCHEGYPLLSSRMSVDRDEHGELVYTYTSLSGSDHKVKCEST